LSSVDKKNRQWQVEWALTKDAPTELLSGRTSKPQKRWLNEVGYLTKKLQSGDTDYIHMSLLVTHSSYDSTSHLLPSHLLVLQFTDCSPGRSRGGYQVIKQLIIWRNQAKRIITISKQSLDRSIFPKMELW
jgi:hypothetical protein